jgi:hypothetical protein
VLVEYMAVWGAVIIGGTIAIIALGPALMNGWNGSKSVILCWRPEEAQLKAQACP